ncbi:flagellar motor switch protein FliN [Stappia sp.]|jgi:flagellar motor switch protein FliN/FliY|uniref:flagellar motor switch protein FliN n=1 Tax=Stappia sp. TaxID=1870903 RepID=UPI003D0F0B5E
MSDIDKDIDGDLPQSGIPLAEMEAQETHREGGDRDHSQARSAADLEAVFDVPVQISAVLGHSRMHVSDLLRLAPGTVLKLDRKVGEAIDIYVNDRLVARGEVVLVEDKLGVTMTEIIKSDR